MSSTCESIPNKLQYIKTLEKRNLIFETILGMTEDGFLIIDEFNNIIEINRAYCEFLGLKQEEVLGKHVYEVIKNSQLPQILQSGRIEVNVLHKLVKGQAPNQEKYCIVTRAPVKQGDQVVAAVGQVKFSLKTMELANKLKNLDEELQYYKNELSRIIGSKYSFKAMIGTSAAFLASKKIAEKAAKNDLTVLLTGETGTGKEVFANAIHFENNRGKNAFIRINCAAIPTELLESELFGYAEGAFTGAKRGGKKGKFELANNGTIFLDEIGDMPLTMQAKLLRVLQENEIEKVGSDETIPINVRVIAATNLNLEEKVKSQAFREDLYYRLNVIQIKIPPLRERSEDIQLYIDYFLRELNEKYETNISISSDTMDTLRNYAWHGNIRELKNTIDRAYALVEDDIILNAHLPVNVISKSRLPFGITTDKAYTTLMEDFERELLVSFLEKNKYNCRKTAVELNIHRTTLYNKIEKLGIKLRE